MHAERLSAYNVAPLAMKAVLEVENYIQQCGLEKSLIELVKMRASQINGCAYCSFNQRCSAPPRQCSASHRRSSFSWHRDCHHVFEDATKDPGRRQAP